MQVGVLLLVLLKQLLRYMQHAYVLESLQSMCCITCAKKHVGVSCKAAKHGSSLARSQATVHVVQHNCQWLGFRTTIDLC